MSCNHRIGDRGTTAGLAWISASLLLVSIAQLSLKYGMNHLPGDPGVHVYLAAIEPSNWTTVLLPILIGIGCYSVSVGCWVAALCRLPLSIAYPLLSLSYFLVSLLAAIFLKENINTVRIIGICLILLGSILVALPAKGSAR